MDSDLPLTNKMHFFYIDDACRYGTEAAVILANLRFWLDKNKANSTNIHDGYVWTYNSARAFSELFPYIPARTLARILKKLEDLGLIKTGNYNKMRYDRTLWYTIPSEYAVNNDSDHIAKMTNGSCQSDQSIMPERQMELPFLTNGSCQSDQPIPYINHIENTDINTDESDPRAETDPRILLEDSAKKDSSNINKSSLEKNLEPSLKEPQKTPPSFEQVLDYVREMGYNDRLAQKFYNKFTAANWEYDGRPVNNWKRLLDAFAARGYERNECEYEEHKPAERKLKTANYEDQLQRMHEINAGRMFI